jgi:hypothetical protein
MSDQFRYLDNNYHLNSQRGTTEYYRCARFQTQGCTARIILKNNKVTVRGEHTCTEPTTAMVNTTQEFINHFLMEQAKNLSKYPNAIYQDLLRQLRASYPSTTFKIPSARQVCERIRYLRGPTTNITGIESPPTQ